MGLFSRVKPKLKAQPKAKESFNGWLKCDGCEELIHQKDLDKTLHCCPKCAHPRDHRILDARPLLSRLDPVFVAIGVDKVEECRKKLLKATTPEEIAEQILARSQG